MAQDMDLPALKRWHVAAVTIGNALEFYDFTVYGYFSLQIGQAFFPSHSAYGSLMLSLATFGAGFLLRPFGALVIGNYADKAGRRPAMMICLIMIGFSTIAMAAIPAYASIGLAAPILVLLARMVQGFSLGGEIGSSTAYLLEAAPPNRRGLVVSWQGASQTIASLLGGMAGLLVTATLPPAWSDAYGWRIAFLLGAASLPFGLWLRRHLPETLHRQEAGAVSVGAQSPIGPSRIELAKAHWRILVMAAVVLASGTIGTYISGYIVTYAQATLHMPARSGFIATTAASLIGIPVLLLGGQISDRLGRRFVNIWCRIAYIISIYPTFIWVVHTHSSFALIMGDVIRTTLVCLYAGSFHAAFIESLPKSIRGSGFGIVYSLSIAIFGGTAQPVVTWLIHVTGNAMAPAWYLLGTGVVALIAIITMMNETAPRRLPVPVVATTVARFAG
jgi:MFS family permease